MSDMSCPIPYVARDEKGIKTLFVDGRPFIVLGGELHNSSASSLEYMERVVWPALRPQNLNTVILSMAWEDVEPAEGCFDFILVDGLIAGAQREGVKLILLWFGTWKNGESFYVPRWVKQDYQKYFRAAYQGGEPSNTISPFCAAALEKDRIAYCELLAHLRDTDVNRTVIMVQLENEVGMLGAERDFSPAANERFAAGVPEAVRRLYGVSGTWTEAFGTDAPENFMAYQYAAALEGIAAAGKAVYPLPVYVNAWLDQHPSRPGSYPSGGPIAKFIPLWQDVAPSIDFVAPDLYRPDFKFVCDSFAAYGNPLFMPETNSRPIAASNVFYAICGKCGMGFSPFAIEDVVLRGGELVDAGYVRRLDIDPAAFMRGDAAPYLARSYQLISSMQQLILETRGTGRMKTFFQESASESGCIVCMDKFDVQIDYAPYQDGKPVAAGVIIGVEGGFFLAGVSAKFKVLPKINSGEHISYIRCEEGEFVDGKWVRGRVLNGDEVFWSRGLRDVPDVRFIGVDIHK